MAHGSGQSVTVPPHRECLLARAVVVCATLLALCWSFPSTASKAETNIPVRFATLRMASPSVATTLDPYASLSTVDIVNIHNLFDPLVRCSIDMGATPRLAERWDRLDPQTMRFYLRPGVRFHSGRELTAQDVVWSVNRAKQSQPFKGLFAPITHAEAVDDYTVDLSTDGPCPLLPVLASYIFPMDREFYTAAGADTTLFARTHVSGTGPFSVRMFEPGRRIELVRREDHWHAVGPDIPGKANVGEVVHTAVAEEAQRTQGLLTGRFDLIYPVPPEDYVRLADRHGVLFGTEPGMRLIGLFPDQTRRAEFRDQRVRRAMALGTDNWHMANTLLKGAGMAAAQFSPPGMVGHAPELAPAYDPEKARQLLAEAGYPDGFTCSMIAPDNRYVHGAEVARDFVRMMGEIGIRVRLTTIPADQYIDAFLARSADIQMLGWQPDTCDTANYFQALLMCSSESTGRGSFNTSGHCSPPLDGLVVQAETEIDLQQRGDLLRRAERMAAQEAAFVPLYWENISWAARAGIKPTPLLNRKGRHFLDEIALPPLQEK